MGILSEIFSELVGAFDDIKEEFSSLGNIETKKKSDPFEQTVAPKLHPNLEAQLDAMTKAPISQQKTELEKHTHAHPAKNNSKVEMRPRYVGSLGNVQDEGCTEHGDERYVRKKKEKISSSTISVSDMRKAVIMSEILGKPKSKR